jgi:hypothetical protein
MRVRRRQPGRALALPRIGHLSLLPSFVAIILFLRFLVPSAALAEADPSIPLGTTHAGDVVALGKRIEIAGVESGSVVAVGGTVVVAGRIEGNLVLLGAGATITRAGRVEGDLLAVGGRVIYRDGASEKSSVGGRIRNVEAIQAAYLSELKTSPVDAATLSPLLLSFRLLLLLAWLVAGLVLLRVSPRPVATAASAARGHLLFLTALGATAFLSGVLLSAFFLSVLPAKAALVLVTAVVVALLGAKIFGLAALFVFLGRRVARPARRGSPFFGDPAALTLGLLSLGTFSLVPLAGEVLWSLASLAAIGLALHAAVPGGLVGAPRESARALAA